MGNTYRQRCLGLQILVGVSVLAFFDCNTAKNLKVECFGGSRWGRFSAGFLITCLPLAIAGCDFFSESDSEAFRSNNLIEEQSIQLSSGQSVDTDVLESKQESAEQATVKTSVESLAPTPAPSIARRGPLHLENIELNLQLPPPHWAGWEESYTDVELSGSDYLAWYIDDSGPALNIRGELILDDEQDVLSATDVINSIEGAQLEISIPFH